MATNTPQREAATSIVRTLRDAGHVAYFAGGCVRDRLLGITPKDYDIATDAPPKRVRELFPRSQYVGQAFGVVLVLTEQSPVEVATFRKEAGYADGRRPDHVEFTNAEQDASRRDFTVNGLFEDPTTDPPTVIDFVQGQADLQAQVLRAIGDPEERFGEDYLRMLRAVRFAARLGFTLESDTQDAIRLHAQRLKQISAERIGMEITAMLIGPRAAQAIEQLQTLGLDAPIFGQPAEDARCPALPSLADSQASPHVAVPLSLWLNHRRPTVAPEQAQQALALPNEVIALWQAMDRLADTPDRWPELTIAQRKRRLAEPAWPHAMLRWRALGADLETIRHDAQALAHDGIGIAPPPFITGDDLIRLGHRPGPAFKTMLDAIYDAQLQGEITSKTQAMSAAGQPEN